MSNPGSPESSRPINKPNESFKDILSQFEQSKSRKPELHEGVEAYKKEGPKFMQRLVAKQKARVKDA